MLLDRQCPVHPKSQWKAQSQGIGRYIYEFKDWRFSLRKSNTEPLARVNVHTRGEKELLGHKTRGLIALLVGS